MLSGRVIPTSRSVAIQRNYYVSTLTWVVGLVGARKFGKIGRSTCGAEAVSKKTFIMRHSDAKKNDLPPPGPTTLI